MALRKIFEYAISLSGAGTTTVNLDPHDISRARSVVGELEITTAGTAAGDTLDVEFQESPDSVMWDTRARHSQQVGNSGASATTPAAEKWTIECRVPLQQLDQVYTPSGAVGGTDLAKGSVRTGPMLGRFRTQTLQPAGFSYLQPTHRLRLVVAQTSAASFTGTYRIWIDTDIPN